MKPSLAELNGLPSGPCLYTTDCSHFTGLHFDEYEYEDDSECRLNWQYGEEWDGLTIAEIEECGGGYVCLVHDFPREMSIAERIEAIS